MRTRASQSQSKPDGGPVDTCLQEDASRHRRRRLSPAQQVRAGLQVPEPILKGNDGLLHLCCHSRARSLSNDRLKRRSGQIQLHLLDGPRSARLLLTHTFVQTDRYRRVARDISEARCGTRSSLSWSAFHSLTTSAVAGDCLKLLGSFSEGRSEQI